jgi:hypothetical protein
VSRLIIFGERPGPNTDPTRPLYPHTTTGAAARLIKLLGVSTEWYLSERNVVRYNAVGDMFTSTADPEPREYVRGRISWHISYDGEPKFLFLGRAAANAGPASLKRLSWGEELNRMMVIPHPSGRNRYYNSQANTHFIEQSLRKFAGTL